MGSGLITSMARPGGNVTGFVIFEYALAAKWLELLKEIAPSVRRGGAARCDREGFLYTLVGSPGVGKQI